MHIAPLRSTLGRHLTRISRGLSTKATDGAERSTRSGQNLSERYLMLERSLRGREVLAHPIAERPAKETMATVISTRKGSVNTFRGLVVPEEPQPPRADGTSH